MKVPFNKMHGLGNDFVVIDERLERYDLSPRALSHIADRRYGVGCDQILFLEAPRDPAALARYRVANADGTPAEHCGNGIRCLARLLRDRGEIDDRVGIEIGEDVFELLITADGQVTVDMGIPEFAPARIPLEVDTEQARYTFNDDNEPLSFGAVSVGNPHATLAVADVQQADVQRLGPALQASPLFPAGVNVGFMQVINSGAISLRVYERGAGETQACGTGACAAVAIGRRWQQLDAAVKVTLRGGSLLVEWHGDAADRISMTGPATHVFEGTIEL